MQLIDTNELLTSIRPEELSAPTDKEVEILRFFNQTYPDQQGNLASFLESETCPCRTSLASALNENPTKAQTLADKLSEVHGTPKRVFNVHKTGAMSSQIRSIAGAVINIKGDSESYSRIIKDLADTHQVYNGLSLKDNTDGTWTLFFY